MRLHTMKNSTLLICVITLSAANPYLQAQGKGSGDKLPAKVASLDKNGDGKLSAKELPPGARTKILTEFDLNNDNTLDALELRVYLLSKKGGKSSPGVVETGGKVTTRKDIEYASGKGYENGLGKLDLYLPAKAKSCPVPSSFTAAACRRATNPSSTRLPGASPCTGSPSLPPTTASHPQ